MHVQGLAHLGRGQQRVSAFRVGVRDSRIGSLASSQARARSNSANSERRSSSTGGGHAGGQFACARQAETPVGLDAAERIEHVLRLGVGQLWARLWCRGHRIRPRPGRRPGRETRHTARRASAGRSLSQTATAEPIFRGTARDRSAHVRRWQQIIDDRSEKRPMLRRTRVGFDRRRVRGHAAEA